MGLGFHIGQGGIDELGEYLGQIEIDEHFWLQNNGFLIKGKFGHFPDSVESLPYFEDVILTNEQVKKIKEKFDLRKIKIFQTPGFKSETVEKMEIILNRVITENKGLSTCAD